ncbi:MAG: isopenicillin N synthase family dioxygenase [Methylophilaceae bacterium]
MTARGEFSYLPVIDITDMYSQEVNKRKKVAAQLGEAARNTGFFYITGHQVSADLRSALLRQTKAFYALPVEQKMHYYIGKSLAHRGYVPEGEEVYDKAIKDKKEAFDIGLELAIDDDEVMAGTPMHGPNVWPDLPDFRQEVSAYYEAVMALGKTLFHGFALALDMPEDYFDAFTKKPTSQLRLVHYPFDSTSNDSQGIGAHTDYECFTILLPTAAGLEVMNVTGDWVDAPPIEDAFIVNIGDMLEIWTGGTFVATTHRVRKVLQERYSFPLFVACDYHTKVAPLPPFATEDACRQYTAINAGAHLYAQTAQTFSYLMQQLAEGTLVLPEGSKAVATFGQEAKQSKVKH